MAVSGSFMRAETVRTNLPELPALSYSHGLMASVAGGVEKV